MTAVYALILFSAPAVSFWLLVPGLDPIGRLVVASMASLCTVSGVAGVMLITGIWSPIVGFATVLLTSVFMALARCAWRSLRSRRACFVTHRRAPRDPVST